MRRTAPRQTFTETARIGPGCPPWAGRRIGGRPGVPRKPRSAARRRARPAPPVRLAGRPRGSGDSRPVDGRVLAGLRWQGRRVPVLRDRRPDSIVTRVTIVPDRILKGRRRQSRAPHRPRRLIRRLPPGRRHEPWNSPPASASSSSRAAAALIVPVEGRPEHVLHRVGRPRRRLHLQ